MVCVPRHKLYTLSTDRDSGDWCSRDSVTKTSGRGRKVAILLFHGKRATFYRLLGPAPTQTGVLTDSSTKIEGLPSLSVYQRVWLPRKRRRSVLRFLLCIATSNVYITAPELPTPIIRMVCNILQTPTLGLYTVRARGEESPQQLPLVRFACLPHTKSREYVVSTEDLLSQSFRRAVSPVTPPFPFVLPAIKKVLAPCLLNCHGRGAIQNWRLVA